jgi:magnesium chelatase subunit I
MGHPDTLGRLKESAWGRPPLRGRRVKTELRANLIGKLEAGEKLFPGIIGYDDSVIPQLVNGVLSRHNLILLGLRGQAKSRILRDLVGLLDAAIPVVAGCEINDDPFAPICRACKALLAERGDEAPIAFLPREARYVEKLATPDVTIADILGDVDPIKAARGGLQLSDELTIHYGLLPRANRGIFAINELPDLAGKIQVGLFNILQEGDVQIKGYPIRLPLDVALVFTANPEDYTARGKIITPLKDRIGSEVRTHYPATPEHGMAITHQEAWTARYPDDRLQVPDYLAEVIELIAFHARRDQKVDKRSGVSQRMPIACLENAVSNAERRAILNREARVVPRIADVYAAMPAITGKFELEYEGELRGADQVARDLIRAATGEAFTRRFGPAEFQAIVDWFNLDGSVRLSDGEGSAACLEQLRRVPGLLDKAAALGASRQEPGATVAAAEFILEGLYAQQRISRSEERGYHGTEQRRGTERPEVPPPDRPERPERGPRKRFVH